MVLLERLGVIHAHRCLSLGHLPVEHEAALYSLAGESRDRRVSDAAPSMIPFRYLAPGKSDMSVGT